MLVREGETLAEVKKRIERKLQVSADEFSKVIHFLKFLLVGVMEWQCISIHK